MQMGYQPEKTLVFLTTAAEELMNFGDAGSEYYAARAAQEGRNIWGVMNNDMIAYDNGSDVIGFSNIIGSEELTGIASLITANYTTLTPDIPSPQSQSGADLQPFIEHGYSGLYLMEDVFNPFYHTDQDLVENCDIPYLTEVIKISCGTMIYSDISLGMNEFVQTKEISAWPNPCSNRLNILIPNTNDYFDIMVLNVSGQLVYSSKASSDQHISIEMDALPGGIYIVKLISSKSMFTKKVIKK